jgi:enterochelin esterase-like enzyme
MKIPPLKAIGAASFVLVLAAAACPVGADRGRAGLIGIQGIASAPAERRAAAADSFVSAFRIFPLISDTLALFIYRASPGRSVMVAGDFNGWNPSADTLREIPGSGLYWRALYFEPDARLDYKIVADGTDWMLDPLNPRICAGGFGPNSELAMPEYIRPGEIDDKPDIPHGKLDTLSFHSVLLKNNRRVIVYLPPSYSKAEERAYPCLYVNDGGEYRTLGSMCNVLNNGIHGGKITDVIAVFIDPVNRNGEYWLNKAYITAVADELVPWIDSRYRTVRNPAGRCIMGASLGGLTALNAVRLQPGVFGLCASQSGAFWIEDKKIVGLVREAKVSNLRVYLDWGSYEPSIPAINVRVADILRSKGCDVKTRVWHEGHSWGSWRGHLAELLGFLFPARPPSL